MREIKFRGKRIDNGEWVYGFVYRHDPPLQCFAGESKEQPAFAILKTGFADWSMPRPIEQHEVDGKTVTEFTGLKDKNGKEIYEGDILKADEDLSYRFGKIGRVEYNDDLAGFCVAGKTSKNQYYETLTCDVACTSEVIGNIHTNPELINL